MALKADHSTLPTAAANRSDGWAPDPEPRFVHLLAEKWARNNDEAGDKPRAFTDARFRHSDAGKCARAIAYAALDMPASNPMDLCGVWNTSLGTLIHDAWQEVLAEAYPDAQIELRVRSVGEEGAGSIDAVVTLPDGRVIAIELKTIGGFGFKGAIGAARKGTPAEGPKYEHTVQAALNAKAVDADEAIVAYLGKETLSVNVADRFGASELGRFCAEWTMNRDAYMAIAEAEERRIAGILGLLDDGQLPARKIPSPELPAGSVIVDPTKGRWELHDGDRKLVDTGTFWACGYCKYQDVCTPTPSGRCGTEVLVEIGGAA